jgi:hypothetical protein
MGTHDTEYHRNDWKPKWKKNKTSSKYLDSGATSHFFKDQPELNYKTKDCVVKTATSQEVSKIEKVIKL